MTELGRILKRISSFEEKEFRDNYLESNGFNLDEVDSEASVFFKRHLANEKLATAQSRKDIFKKAVQLVKQKTKEMGAEDLSILFKTKGNESFAYQFSKLSEVSEEDMLSMLNDEELLKVIDKLEN